MMDAENSPPRRPAALSSHQAKVPPVATEYFAQYEADQDAREHPIIGQVFYPERGWRRQVFKKRVSRSWLLKLRSDGATAVMLSAYGHDVDFTIAELTKVDRRPLLGGALIGSRTWPAR
jgi:hypothetical protein